MLRRWRCTRSWGCTSRSLTCPRGTWGRPRSGRWTLRRGCLAWDATGRSRRRPTALTTRPAASTAGVPPPEPLEHALHRPIFLRILQRDSLSDTPCLCEYNTELHVPQRAIDTSIVCHLSMMVQCECSAACVIYGAQSSQTFSCVLRTRVTRNGDTPALAHAAATLSPDS